MARQKVPPPSASSHSDTSSVDGDPSADKEHVVKPQQTPSAAKTATTNPSKRQDEDESSSEGEEEEEEEEEEVEVPPSKKAKRSAPPPPPPPPPKKPSSGAINRIWDLQDEKTLLEALSAHLSQNGELPPKKDYASFLSTTNIRVPFSGKQMHNKIRRMKNKYNKMVLQGKKIPDATSSDPDASSLFPMWARLFAAQNEKEKKGKGQKKEKGSVKASKSKKRASLNIPDGSTSKGDMATDVNVACDEAGDGAGNVVVANGGGASDDRGNGSGADGVDVAGSNSYLGQMIKNMISRQQFPWWVSTVEDVVLRINKLKATKLEAKAMILSHDAIKLSARRLALESEVFQTLADVMTDDN